MELQEIEKKLDKIIMLLETLILTNKTSTIQFVPFQPRDNTGYPPQNPWEPTVIW